MVGHLTLVPNDDRAANKLPNTASTDTKNIGFDIKERYVYPLYPKLTLIAVHLPGTQSDVQTFHTKL